MSRKSRERYKDRNKDQPESKPTPTADTLRKRRNRRLIFVGLIGLSFPILEVIAYQFRAITITLDNRSGQLMTGLTVSYPGGAFEVPEIKPGDSLSRLIRPDFQFRGSEFSTYSLTIWFATTDGTLSRQSFRVGTIDYSATEKYTVEPNPLGRSVELKHTTAPGFPLSLIRDLMTRLGFG